MTTNIPRFQQAWFLGSIAGSDEVFALHSYGVQRHHGEWRVSPLDDLEIEPARLEKCSCADDGMRLAITNLVARRDRMCGITKVGTLRNAENEFSLKRYLTRGGLLRQRNDF